MTVCYLGLGSNLDQPKQQLLTALDILKNHSSITVLNTSSLYQSAALGPENQNSYINAVVKIDTDLSPDDLLRCCKEIEVKMGRAPSKIKWSSRIIDIDILLFGNQIINTLQLIVPHREIANRNFVLLPLQEINPELMIPGLQSLQDLLANCPHNKIKKLA